MTMPLSAVRVASLVGAAAVVFTLMLPSYACG